MKNLLALAGFVFIAAVSPTPAQAQLMYPPGWKWTTDAPSKAIIGDAVGDTAWRFTQMAPGFHVTTRPAALMYDATIQASGRYAVESVQILFPGTSQSGYGLFVGGRDLDAAGAQYVAFLVRRDGQVAIERRAGGQTTTLVRWMPAAAVKLAPKAEETVSNTLRVSVELDSMRFSVNAQPVAAVARRDLPVDGYFGFRTGADLNMHITTIDFTRRLATVPPPKPAP